MVRVIKNESNLAQVLGSAGGLPWLDFVNSLPLGSLSVDCLATPEALLAWLQLVGLPIPSQDPNDATLAQAKAFRKLLAGLAEDLAAGRAPSAPAISEIEARLSAQQLRWQLDREGEGWTLVLRRRLESLTDLLAYFAESAADTLANRDLGRIHQCAHPDCPLYFYDLSKGGKRRWCSMEVCGNRTKATAHYRRYR